MRYLRDVERAHGLPRGRRQPVGRVNGRTVYRDVDFEEFALRVELDGRLWHEKPRERERDRVRDNATVVELRGTVHYGYAAVTGTPCAVAVEVAAAPTNRGWTGLLRPCVRGCTP
jgi:hypothetical protein